VYGSIINDKNGNTTIVDFDADLAYPGQGAIRAATLTNNAISSVDNGPFYSFKATPGAKVLDQGSDTSTGVAIYWGRYAGQFTLSTANFAGSANAGSYHAMYAASTTDLGIAKTLADTTMPQLVNATYNVVLGNTSPTNLAGTAGTLNSLSVGVNFSNQTLTSYDLKATVGGTTWTAGLSGGPMALSGFTNPNANGAGANSVVLSGSCGAGCTATGSARGAFVGDQAQALITSYSLKNNTGTDGITGTAAVKR
jgi:hypothetical protein